MQRFVLIGSLALASAISASQPSRAQPLPAFSWTGFYGGIQGGYVFGQDNTFGTAAVKRGIGCSCGGGGGDLAAPVADVPVAASFFSTRVRPMFADLSSDPDGVVGGGHVGYNFSASPFLGAFGAPIIYGIEGDVEGLDNGNTQFEGRTFARIKSDLQGSIRGRLGFGFDRFLVYGTGGAAFGAFESTYGLSNLAQQSFDTTRVGYTVGGGIAYAFANNWSVDVEYRYSDFGSFTDNFATRRPAAAVFVRDRETDQRVEAGISYQFARPAPTLVAEH